ncbi:MAG TPA: hypothetical protein VI316_08035 [Candidatus Dormibacteraeota bacterium]
MRLTHALGGPIARSWRRVQEWRSSLTPRTQQARATGWESLAVPVAGHSTIGGVPVAVVAVRRNSEADELEVVRGHHPTPAWPGVAPPPDAKRHILPALSFIPHPRRELRIGGQRFFFGSVPNAVRCADCGGDHHGFGFVTSDDPTAEAPPEATKHTALCESCAAKRAR